MKKINLILLAIILLFAGNVVSQNNSKISNNLQNQFEKNRMTILFLFTLLIKEVIFQKK